MVEKSKLFSDESVASFSDWLKENHLVDLAQPQHEDQESLALKKLLEEYSAIISHGYHLVMSEIASDPTKKARINDFRLKTNIIRQMKNPADAGELLKEHGVLQGVLGITGESMGDMYCIAENFFEQKKYDQASWILQYLLFLNPYLCWVWQKLAQCAQAQNQWGEAVWALGVALNCDPKEPELYRLAVDACLEAKEYDQAKEFVQFGLEHSQKLIHQEKALEIRQFLEGLMEYIQQQHRSGGESS